jgi:hypothetical protein
VGLSVKDEQDVAALSVTGAMPSTSYSSAPAMIDDLLARMRVPGGRQFRGDLDAHLNDLPSQDTQIVPLQIGALGCLLSVRDIECQTASDETVRCVASAAVSQSKWTRPGEGWHGAGVPHREQLVFELQLSEKSALRKSKTQDVFPPR